MHYLYCSCLILDRIIKKHNVFYDSYRILSSSFLLYSYHHLRISHFLTDFHKPLVQFCLYLIERFSLRKKKCSLKYNISSPSLLYIFSSPLLSLSFLSDLKISKTNKFLRSHEKHIFKRLNYTFIFLVRN